MSGILLYRWHFFTQHPYLSLAGLLAGLTVLGVTAWYARSH